MGVKAPIESACLGSSKMGPIVLWKEMTVMGHEQKDLWDKTKICTEMVIAIAALAFTVTYNIKQIDVGKGQLSVANLNLAVARAQTENLLVQVTCSTDPRLRSMGLYLAEALDKPFAVRLGQVLSLTDPNASVRTGAVAMLRTLSSSGPTEVRSAARSAVADVELIEELRGKGLLQKLRDAEGYLSGRNESGKDQALKLYRDVLSQLSDRASKHLDTSLLNQAKQDIQAQDRDAALSKFQSVFAAFLIAAN